MTVSLCCLACGSSESARVVSHWRTLGRKMWAFVFWREDWNDCAGNVGGILQLCLAPDRCHLGPGQDRIKKKTIQNLIFDNLDWIWSQLRKKMFIYASCDDSNNDKMEKPYIVLFQAYSLKVKKGVWAMNNCSWCAVVFGGLFMFLCGSIPFCKYFDEKRQVERRSTSVFNNFSRMC